MADAALDTSLESEGFVGAGGNDDDFAGLKGQGRCQLYMGSFGYRGKYSR